MPVIVFANNKGGSGKSTSALVLAGEFAEFSNVTIIDADPRRPIAKWATVSTVPDSMEVIRSKGENFIQDEIDDAAAKVPFVIVDLEGTASKLASYAMAEADLVIIPSQEQQQDAEAAIETLAEVKRAGRSGRRDIPATVLLTRTKAAVKSRTAKSISADLRNHDAIGVLDTELVERDAFSALFSIGGTLHQLSIEDVPGLPKAKVNASAYAGEVIDMLRNHQASSGGEK